MHVVGVGGVLGEEQRGGEHGEHPRAVQFLGQRVRGERHQQGQPDLQRGVAEQRPSACSRPSRAPARRPPRRPRRARGRAAARPARSAGDRRGDRDVVEHDRRDVVEEALALQDRHQPARQPELPATAVAATGSGGATSAPSATAAASGRPGTIALATAATAGVVTNTRATASRKIGRLFAANCRHEVRRTAAYSNGGSSSGQDQVGRDVHVRHEGSSASTMPSSVISTGAAARAGLRAGR